MEDTNTLYNRLVLPKIYEKAERKLFRKKKSTKGVLHPDCAKYGHTPITHTITPTKSGNVLARCSRCKEGYKAFSSSVPTQ